jgi:hypothetical protein
MRSFLIASTVVLISSAAMADASAPAMTLGTVDAEMSQDDCLTKAVGATRHNGFTENFEKLGKTVYGEKGAYTSAIRCETAAKLAIFVVAGPDDKITDSSNNKIRTTFAAP